MSFLETVIESGHIIIEQQYRVDVLEFVSRFQVVTNPSVLISSIASVIYAIELSDQQVEGFKSALIPGLPDFEWTIEYSAYLADPQNEQKRMAIENRLRSLLVAMVVSPIFQLH